MGQNLYTQTQVQNALQRGLVGLLLISQKIQSQFLYFNTLQYNTYKRLQYDIYCLWRTISNEQGYIGYTDVPANTYEQGFYGLVGALIDKTGTVDNTGAYGGALNPYYQAPNTIINVVVPGFTPTVLTYNAANLVSDGNGGYYLPVTLPTGIVPVSITINGVSMVGWTYDGTYTPARIWGFANATSPQAIIVTAV